jgi:hypothetical protein
VCMLISELRANMLCLDLTSTKSSAKFDYKFVIMAKFEEYETQRFF